jgi:hypothetical protein
MRFHQIGRQRLRSQKMQPCVSGGCCTVLLIFIC